MKEILKINTLPYRVKVVTEFDACFYIFDGINSNTKTIRVGTKFWACKCSKKDGHNITLLFNGSLLGMFHNALCVNKIDVRTEYTGDTLSLHLKHSLTDTYVFKSHKLVI